MPRSEKRISFTEVHHPERAGHKGEDYGGDTYDDEGKCTIVHISHTHSDKNGKAHTSEVSERKPGHLTVEEKKEILEKHHGKNKIFIMKSLGKGFSLFGSKESE